MQHLGSVLVVAVLAGVVFLILRSMIRQRKKGGGCCGNHCGNSAQEEKGIETGRRKISGGRCRNAAMHFRTVKALAVAVHTGRDQ